MNKKACQIFWGFHDDDVSSRDRSSWRWRCVVLW